MTQFIEYSWSYSKRICQTMQKRLNLFSVQIILYPILSPNEILEPQNEAKKGFVPIQMMP